MNAKFNCPRCNAAVEASANQAGMAGDCPACGELLIVPAQQTPPPAAIQPQKPKKAEDYAADAICMTAKGAWKVTKFAAPFVRRFAAAVVGFGKIFSCRAQMITRNYIFTQMCINQPQPAMRDRFQLFFSGLPGIFDRFIK